MALAGGLALTLAAAVLAGCVRKWPVFYPPAWSPDGRTLRYAALRPDGTVAVREVDVASGRRAELAAARFSAPPVAIASSPQGDQVACAVVLRDQGRPPLLRLHILSAGGAADRAAWEAPCVQGAAELAWSPDGRSVVVSADGPGGWALHCVPAAGGPPRTLAAGLCEARGPAVAPDGRRVAFVARARPGEPWALCLAPLEGSAYSVAEPAIFREYVPGYWPAWSPRGDLLAYVAERHLCPGFAEIALWSPASGTRRVLARNLAGACLAPAWSPKGDALAFVSLPLGPATGDPGAGGQPADILVVDPEGKSTLTLAADGLANLMPSWSPDGAAIAFHTCAEPGTLPHCVRVGTMDGAPPRLAEAEPEARFALEFARHRRKGTPAPAALAALAGQIANPQAAASAHQAVAEAYAAQGDWANAASHAQRAVPQEGQGHPDVLRLLATARMRVGDPAGALEAIALLRAKRDSDDLRALEQALRQGIETASRLEAELREAPSPLVLQALADTQLQLGNPRQALDSLVRLARAYPSGTHLAAAAASIFRACEQLGPKGTSSRLLEWAAGAARADTLGPEQLTLLAESCAAGGDAPGAARWASRLPPGKLPPALACRAAEAALAAAAQLAPADAEAALGAARHALALAPGGALGARAALETARLLVERDEHWEATTLLLNALAPAAAPATRREAIRLLAAGRVQRRHPVAYDTAEVAELAAFGYLESAVSRGLQLLQVLPGDTARRARLRGAVDAAYAGLFDCHRVRGDMAAARAVADAWLRWATRHERPRALASLAVCHRMAGDRGALVEILSQLALEFADQPEGLEARRELLRLDISPTSPSRGQ